MMKNFNPNVKFRTNGETMLHICAEFNCVELFEWVALEHGGYVF